MEDHVLQVAIYLIAIIGMIVACGFLLRRLNNGILPQQSAMKIVASLSLGLKEKLIVVDVAGQQVLLGITPGNIQKLSLLENPTQESDSPVMANTATGATGFQAKLQELLQRQD